jgi:hypothetical protein
VVKDVEAAMAKEAFKQYGMPEPEELGPNGEESFEREYTPAFLARQDLLRLRLAQVQRHEQDPVFQENLWVVELQSIFAPVNRKPPR